MFGRRGPGLEEEFTAFVVQAGPSLQRTALALTGSAAAADDLVQQTLVKTYVAWPRIRRDGAYAYARRVLANQRIDTWRSTRHEHPMSEVPDQPGRQDTATDDRDQLVRLLAALPDQQRRVVVLRYYNDLSEQAVADLLGISVGAVKSAASRGLATLRSAGAAHDSTQAGTR